MPTRRQHGTRWISTRAMSHDGCRRLQRNIDSGSRFCCPADSADHDFWRSGGASISYSVGSGHPAGPRPTDFRNSIAYGAGQSAGVGFASAIVTSLFASGYCRAWSSANGVNPARIGVGRAAGTSVVASVNPYPDQQRGVFWIQRRTDDQLCEGRRKVKGKSFARTLPAAKPPGWTRKLYGTAFGVVVGSAGHSSGTSSSSGAT